MRPSILVAFACAGCSQHVYSPPAQAYSLGPLHALPPGSAALDLEGSRSGQVFDPKIDAASARVRAGIASGVEGSLEGAMYTVDDSGPSTANRRIYVGRAGVRVGHPGIVWLAGLGGGFAPSGGPFVSADTGVAFGYDNCVVVPVVQVTGFVSVPLAPRPIDVSDDATTTFSTPSTTFGGTIHTGLRFALSPSRCRAHRESPWITIGGGITSMNDATTGATFAGVGIGLELPLGR